MSRTAVFNSTGCWIDKTPVLYGTFIHVSEPAHHTKIRLNSRPLYVKQMFLLYCCHKETILFVYLEMPCEKVKAMTFVSRAMHMWQEKKEETVRW